MLSLAAIFGITLLSFVLRGKHTPKGIVVGHGLLALVSLALLIMYSIGPGPDPLESLILLLVAAVGGAILVSRDFSGKSLPKWLAVAHGLIALAGLAFLAVFRLA
jgi:hypothetical protein